MNFLASFSGSSEVKEAIRKGWELMSNFVETGSFASLGRSDTLALTLLLTSTSARSGFVPDSISTASIDTPSRE